MCRRAPFVIIPKNIRGIEIKYFTVKNLVSKNKSKNTLKPALLTQELPYLQQKMAPLQIYLLSGLLPTFATPPMLRLLELFKQNSA